ncbi:MAG: hypothetical protein JOY51_06715, partial [Nevskia sp.]|nr:hypothetical protein [Nevskia sp.]
MKHLAALVLPLCLAACAPLPLQDAPHMYGRVVSAAEGSAIRGASVYYESKPGQVIQSGKDGDFEFPAVHGLHIVAIWGSD